MRPPSPEWVREIRHRSIRGAWISFGALCAMAAVSLSVLFFAPIDIPRGSWSAIVEVRERRQASRLEGSKREFAEIGWHIRHRPLRSAGGTGAALLALFAATAATVKRRRLRAYVLWFHAGLAAIVALTCGVIVHQMLEVKGAL